MKQIKWNDAWRFWEDRDSFSLVWSVPDTAESVTLPHDAMIERSADPASLNGGSTGYRSGGNYTYVKQLCLGAEELSDRFVLKFDGVYCHAMVYVNEQLAGSEAYGYSTFYVDIAPFLHEGENEIRVLVRNGGMSNSRWYSGSGIYRDVSLLRSGPVHIAPDGVQSSTVEADEEYALLSVCTEVVNGSARAKTLRLHTVLRDTDGTAAGAEDTAFFLRAGTSRKITQRILVSKPSLWSDVTPALYSVESRLTDGEAELDQSCERIGLRTLSLDTARGLRVNGRAVRLRGACIHHDSGLLGAATYADAQRRQIRLLKEAGFNAVRMAHHPAAPALLSACDELGMYVMDEFADMWSRPKSDLDYALDFSRWWEHDVALMVKKDFNHPSVIMYSVGNEIPEIGTDAGSELCAQISESIRTLDPTRYITAGINGVFAVGDRMGQILSELCGSADDGEPGGNVNDFMTVMDSQMDRIVTHPIVSERLEKACAPLDIAGYNYMAARYEPDAARYPNRVMVGSETYPPDIARNWALVKRLPAVIGDFTWTGWDYIGEAGVGIPAYAFGEGGFGAKYPCQLAYCGDFDLTGFRRPLSYYREIVFGLRSQPYIAVQDPHHYGEHLIKTPWVMSDADAEWDWPGFEGKPIVVEVYAPGDTAELRLNGRVIGRKELADFRAVFDIVYEPGVLTAAAYAHDEKLSEKSLSSPSGEAQLCLEAEDAGEELIFLRVTKRDGQGVVCTASDELLTAEIEGSQLLGFGSGDPKPLNNYNEGKAVSYHGQAQLILRRTGSGPIRASVHAESGTAAEIVL